MADNVDTCFTYATPHGPVTLRATRRGLVEVAFSAAPRDAQLSANATTNQAANELQEYLAGKRTSFDVPLDPQGSAFQHTVWECVCEIPYGETRTAADVAAAIGKPGSHRSVGTAIKLCRLAPFIPAHRVMAANATGQQAKIFRAFVALEGRARA
ncbi:MAG: methylated-DNA--[Eggerthellaceae bacterium]|nr:methylated-DNA--[protein]-cysteine S-methyltransferase [Eggerthellaceae bacterium]